MTVKITRSHDGKLNINNIPIEQLSFSKINTALKDLHEQIKDLEKEAKDAKLLKNNMSTIKENVNNNKLSDADFRDFINSFF